MSLYTKKIVLFDGECSFCNSTVSFLFDRNKKRSLYFASQQSDVGLELLHFNKLSTDLNTIYYYSNGMVYEKAQAFFQIAKELDSSWKYLSMLQNIIPLPIANWCYDRIAKRRHLILGKKDTCRLMTAEEREYFLL